MPTHYEDLMGQRFGKLYVCGIIHAPHGKVRWICRCDCGNEIVVSSRVLKFNHRKSCGCIHSKQVAKRNHENGTHYSSHSKLYGVWHGAKQRCYDPGKKDYPRYGGRGIKMCDEWKNSFSVFKEWAYSHGYDEDAPFMKCTLDRINNDGDYCPENCRFVDMKVQAGNRKKRGA